jgi:hypothetical protein
MSCTGSKKILLFCSLVRLHRRQHEERIGAMADGTGVYIGQGSAYKASRWPGLLFRFISGDENKDAVQYNLQMSCYIN